MNVERLIDEALRQESDEIIVGSAYLHRVGDLGEGGPRYLFWTPDWHQMLRYPAYKWLVQNTPYGGTGDEDLRARVATGKDLMGFVTSRGRFVGFAEAGAMQKWDDPSGDRIHSYDILPGLGPDLPVPPGSQKIGTSEVGQGSVYRAFPGGAPIYVIPNAQVNY